MWRVVDLNGSNCMLKNEYHTLLMRLGMGPDVSEKYTDEDFAKYDVELGDNDGHIRYKEFKVIQAYSLTVTPTGMGKNCHCNLIIPYCVTVSGH